MFGYSIVKTGKLTDLIYMEGRIRTAHRWLSGFKDLDIIWDWLFGTSDHAGIDNMRTAYARVREATDYGKPLDQVRLESAEAIADLILDDPLLVKHQSRSMARRYRERYPKEHS